MLISYINLNVDAFSWLWRLKIPSNVAAFIWRLSKGKLPSKVNLRRNIMLQDLDYTCSFCKIWIIFCLGVVFHIVYGAIVIIGWVCLRYNIGIGGIIFFQHNYHWLGKGKTRVWRFVWCAEVWALWRHSNNIIFRQHILDFDSVIEHIEFLT